jgi:VWFA-related protein
MVARRVTVLGCVVFLAAVSLSGQQPSAPAPAPPAGAPSQTPTFRAGIDAVTVDVMVTDRQGRPVVDLKAEDFEILENKRPQTVQTFKFIKVDDVAAVQSSFTRDIQSMDDQRREAAREDTRLLVIFLDDYHVRLGNSLTVKQQLAKFISQLTPNDLVAVMYPLTPSNTLTFSRNHESTAAAVMGFMGRKYNYVPTNPYEWPMADYPPETLEQVRNDVVITALRGVATFLGTLKEGRKHVLFVSEGMTGTMPMGVTTRGEQALGIPRAATNQSQQFFAQADLQSKMNDIFRAAARSNTAFFTLDPRGLAIGEAQINDNISQEADRASLNAAQDTLHILASNTDGRAIVNRNEPFGELQKMTAELSAYYLLGYTSTEAPRDGKFHEITVRVKRRDLEIRARKGYWAYSAEDVARATSVGSAGPPAAVEDALNTLGVSREHPVRLWVGSQRGADGKASVTVAWEPVSSGVAVTRPRSAQPEVVDRIVLTATSPQGEVLFRGPVPRAPQGATPAGAIVFAAPPGPMQLNIIAEDARGMRLDRDDTTVDVPDFTRVATVITTPVVYRGRTVRDIQLIRAAASPVPAVAREFLRTERLLLRFQAYAPGGASPAITLRLLNNLGRAMSDLPAPATLADGTLESEMGLASLAPGKYLIEINGKTENDSAQVLFPFQVTP